MPEEIDYSTIDPQPQHGADPQEDAGLYVDQTPEVDTL